MTDRFKFALRQSCQHIRKSLPPVYQHNASAKICAHIYKTTHYRKAKRIALYQAIQGEISLSSLWQTAASQGKYCYFPVLNEDKTLFFLPATPATTFKENRYGINEPVVDKKEAILPEEIDIIFLPVVAFDGSGTRLGMGAGYYDRTLANNSSSILIGVAYDFQHFSYLQPHSWDIPLTAIVTPETIYWVNND